MQLLKLTLGSMMGLILLGSCASSYKPIRPELFSYTKAVSQDSLELSYHYDVLQETGNKKYAKHETNKLVKVVMVKISNYTGHVVNPFQDAIFYANGVPVKPLDPMDTKKRLKQPVPVYLLYLLLTPINLYYTPTSNNSYDTQTPERQTIPVGFVLGPGITALNMIKAGTANKKFLDELQLYTIDTKIQNGQTIYGLVAFENIGYDPITIKLK